MISHILVFLFSTFLFSANSTCPSGYFTNNNPCDTKATLLQSSAFTSAIIGPGQWHYYYMPLAGISNDFGFSFKVDTPYLEAFMDFQEVNQYQLPDGDNFDYGFYVENGNRDIPFQTLTDGMPDRSQGKMLLGIYNPYSSNVNIQIEYYKTDAEEVQSKKFDFIKSEELLVAFNKLVMAIIIAVFVIASVTLCFGLVVKRCLKRRRAAIRRANRRTESDIEAQGIPVVQLAQIQPNQNPVKSANDVLTLKEFQKYFPKKPFGKLENHFQQTGCSVCLEDFSAKTECHQLYCNHIFHEACIEAWCEKQNNCPACRVPLGKKAIKEFLKTQKKQNEAHVISPKEIKIQGSKN